MRSCQRIYVSILKTSNTFARAKKNNRDGRTSKVVYLVDLLFSGSPLNSVKIPVFVDSLA